MAFQFRRGSDVERQSITPSLGEPLFVTDTGALYIGDGVTQGGLAISTPVSSDENPSLGGDLDLGNNDIVGTGNINIDGTITATGNINLGDGEEDNLIVGGVIGSDLIPEKDRKYDLGSPISAWQNGYFGGLAVDGEIATATITLDNLLSPDSTVIYESATNTINVSEINTDIITATSLGRTLDLNGNDIVGTGNVNIDGTITATGNINLGDEEEDNIVVSGQFSSSLVPDVDGSHDVGTSVQAWREGFFKGISVGETLTVTGQIYSDLIPNTDDIYDFGAQSIRWRNGFFTNIDADTLQVDNIQLNDNTTIFDGNTNSIFAESVSANTLQVDNIRLNDSTTIFNGNTNSLFAESVVANTLEGNLIGNLYSEDSSIIIDSENQKMTITQIDSGLNDLLIGAVDETSDAGIEMYSTFNYKFHSVEKSNELTGFLNTRKSNGTLPEPLPVDTGQLLGGVVVQGLGTDWASAGGLRVSVDESATFSSDSFMKGVTELIAFDNDGENANSSLKLTSEGNASVNIFSANQYLQTGFYTDVTERDNLISSPQQGSIIFVQDNGSGNPKFQGYTGTSWVDLN